MCPEGWTKASFGAQGTWLWSCGSMRKEARNSKETNMKRSPTQSALARLGAASATMIAIGIVASPSYPQCQYEVTIIQAPECAIFGFPPTIGLGLSEQGHVVGTHLDCEFIDDEAFVWTPETGLVTLPFPAGTIRKRAYDIEGGLIVGRFDILGDGLADLAFLYDQKTGELTNLGTLPGHNWSEAYAISQQQGRIVGFSMNNATGRPLQAVIWDMNGEITNIGEVLLPPNSVAYSINDMTGEVTGWMGSAPHIDAHAFIWREGVVIDLGPIQGGFSSEGHGISTASEVVGWGKVQSSPTVWHAFVASEGTMVDIGTLPTFLDSFAMDIGEAGQVIGSCGDSDVFPTTGFIWQDNVMTDLNELIDPGLGVHISSGRAINHAGEILARGTVEGDAVSVLLTPTPAPIGDLDGDCRVAILDLLSLLAAWGTCDECSADLDNDGYVGIADLLILLSNWG